MRGRNTTAGAYICCLLVKESLFKLSFFWESGIATSAENHSFNVDKTAQEKFREPFQVNPAVLPQDVTCMPSKDTEKTNNLKFF